MKARNILIALYVKHEGDWVEMYEDIIKKEYPEEMFEDTKVKEMCENPKVITILDDEYPEHLRHIFYPPFVIVME